MRRYTRNLVAKVGEISEDVSPMGMTMIAIGVLILYSYFYYGMKAGL